MTSLSEQDITRIESFARAIRVEVLTMLSKAGSGHTAGSLGLADIMALLYGHVLSHDPDDPEWAKRDRLIFSAGHLVPVRYAAMAILGYFPRKELATLRQLGSRLQGHPERMALPGLETTSGPLGDGLPQAAGIALAAQLDGVAHHTYCITSDGEHQAGIIWEAIMFAAKNKLGNLTNIVARNRIQIGGDTEDVMPLEPFIEKYEAFGWHVVDVDGHNIEMVADALMEARSRVEQPSVLIAHTIPGKGVPELEGDHHWHGKAPTVEQAAAWIQALTQ